jgi:peroxiredoxin
MGLLFLAHTQPRCAALASCPVPASMLQSKKRWCDASGLDSVITLSDHKAMSFSDAYGTHIKEWRVMGLGYTRPR